MPRGNPSGGRIPPPGPPGFQQPPQQWQQPPAYPQQPPPCPQGQGGAPRPYTRWNWSVISAAIGTVIGVIGVTALDWFRDTPITATADLWQEALNRGILSDKLGNHVNHIYLAYGALLLILGSGIYTMLWTGGAVRGKTSSWCILGISGKGLAKGRFGWTTVGMITGVGLLSIAHLIEFIKITDGELGEVGPGGWATLAGAVIITVSAGVGPRKPAAQPQPYPPQPYPRQHVAYR